MFYRLITGSSTRTVLVILAISMFTWISTFMNAGDDISLAPGNQMPLFQLLISLFQDNIGIMSFMSYLIMIIQAFLLVRLSMRYNLLDRTTFLPALLFMILCGHLPGLRQINSILLSNFFIIILIYILLRSSESGPNSYRYFDAGLIIGTGSLFYAPLVYYLVFVWISVMIIRNDFYWREYLYPLLGITAIYMLYSGWCIFFSKDLKDVFEIIGNQLFTGLKESSIDLKYKFFMAYLLVLIFLASFYMIKVYQFRKIFKRNFFLIMFWLFVISTLIFIIIPGAGIYLIYMISIPVSFILTNYFINAKNTFGNRLMLYFLVAGVILLQISEWFGF